MDHLKRTTMNSLGSETQKAANCGGRCVIEMQKKLNFDVMTEFFEVVRDFHNDYKTSNELKKLVIAESNECIKLLNQKTAEMCSMIDEVFLNRRNQQSSFHRLCYKLARAGTSESNCFLEDSKCICFSEENLKKFNVNVCSDVGIGYKSNIMSTISAINNLHGELECTKCHGLFQTSRFKSGSVCDCHAPSISSLHKLHEAILDLFDGKNLKNADDSWYLKHLRRDAEYYRNQNFQSSMPSDESVESFEVISSENMNSRESIKMKQESETNSKEMNREMMETLSMDIEMSELMISPEESELSDYVTWPDSKASEFKNTNKSSFKEMEPFLQNPPDKSQSEFFKTVSPANNRTHNESDLADISSSSTEISKMLINRYSKTLNVDSKNGKSNEQQAPADVIKKSFYQYLNNGNDKNFTRDFLLKHPNVEVAPLNSSLNRVDLVKFHNFVNENSLYKSVSGICKKNPSEALKCALNSYMINKLENTNKWLRRE